MTRSRRADFFSHVRCALFGIVLLLWSGKFADGDIGGELHDSELEALRDLYISTDGENWLWRNTSTSGAQWNITNILNQMPCSDNWQGLNCAGCGDASTSCHVVEIILHNYRLIGSIPDTIANLSRLENFNLSSNQIDGTLPTQLYELPFLRSLDVSRNNITGLLPRRLVIPTTRSGTKFSYNTSLTGLFLQKNKFSGGLPCVFGKLTELRYIDLNDNSLLGNIPSCFPNNISKVMALGLGGNQFFGSLPITFAYMDSLEELDLSNNFLYGSLPFDILGKLPNLHSLQLDFNFFSGSIPSTNLESMFPSLLSIDLFRNRITGPMPYNFPPSLLSLAVSGNNISGTLPGRISELKNLLNLDISNNSFTGTLPMELGYMSNLLYFYAPRNKFNGTLYAKTWRNMTSLHTFDVGHNQLTGTIGDEITALPSVKYLSLNDNFFTGRLPDSIGNLQNLVYVDFGADAEGGNCFSSNWPDTITSIKGLEFLLMDYCCLSGTVPIDISELRSLLELKLSGNFFTGTIPPWVGSRLLNLVAIGFNDNLFTGKIPTDIGGLAHLTTVQLQDNYLSGSIPAALTQSAKLIYLNVSTNAMHGTIPKDVSRMKVIRDFDLSTNFFSGTLPIELQYMNTLEILFLQNNRFTGNLYSFTNASQLRLHSIDVSSNYFTGTIPVTPFQLEGLITFAASINCLHGTLPEDICQSHSLETLALNGLSSALSCRNRFFEQFGLRTYSLHESVSGEIPSCYFNMSALTTLQLAGNKLSGELPQGNNGISSFLSYLTLSHNHIGGDIPNTIQDKVWIELDLSYNRFTGRLKNTFGEAVTIGETSDDDHFGIPDTNSYDTNSYDIKSYDINSYDNNEQTSGDISSNSVETTISGNYTTTRKYTDTLYLIRNRLSGEIPSSFYSVQTLSVLTGNVFSCDFKGSELPTQDPDSSNYQCGSNTFNQASIVWLAASFVIFVPLFGMWMLAYCYSKDDTEKSVEDNLHCDSITSKQSLAVSHESEKSSNNSSILSISTTSQRRPWCSILPLVDTSTALLNWVVAAGAILRDKRASMPVITPPNAERTTPPLSMSSSEPSFASSNEGSFFRTMSNTSTSSLSSRPSSARLPNLAEIYVFHAFCKDLKAFAVRITFVATFVLLPLYVGISSRYHTYSVEYAWTVAYAFQEGRIASIVGSIAFMSVLLYCYVLLTDMVARYGIDKRKRRRTTNTSVLKALIGIPWMNTNNNNNNESKKRTSGNSVKSLNTSNVEESNSSTSNPVNSTATTTHVHSPLPMRTLPTLPGNMKNNHATINTTPDKNNNDDISRGSHSPNEIKATTVTAMPSLVSPVRSSIASRPSATSPRPSVQWDLPSYNSPRHTDISVRPSHINSPINSTISLIKDNKASSSANRNNMSPPGNTVPLSLMSHSNGEDDDDDHSPRDFSIMNDINRSRASHATQNSRPSFFHTSRVSEWRQTIDEWVHSSKSAEEIQLLRQQRRELILQITVLSMMVFINTIIVTFANGVFVYITIYSSSKVILFAEIALAAFKAVWNSFILFDLRRFIVKKRTDELNEDNEIDDNQSENNNATANAAGSSIPTFTGSAMVSFMIIFNMVIIPCLAICAISLNCFFNLFSPPSSITSSYEYEQCRNLNYNGHCLLKASEARYTSFQPPFSYSYQCSSDLIRSYAATFVYLFIIHGCFDTVFSLTVMYWSRQFGQYKNDGELNPRANENGIFARVMKRLLRLLQYFFPLMTIDFHTVPGQYLVSSNTDISDLSPSRLQELLSNEATLLRTTTPETAPSTSTTNVLHSNASASSATTTSASASSNKNSPSSLNESHTPSNSIGHGSSKVVVAAVAVEGDEGSATNHNNNNNENSISINNNSNTDNNGIEESNSRPTSSRISSMRSAVGNMSGKLKSTIIRKISLFGKVRCIIVNVGFLSILMTFGIIFPPLAVIGTISMITRLYLTELMLGNALIVARDRNRPDIAASLIKNCTDVPEYLLRGRKVIWQLIIFSAIFYSAFLFDTLGASDGYAVAIYSFYVIIVFGILLCAYDAIYFSPYGKYLPYNTWLRKRHEAASIHRQQAAAGEAADNFEERISIKLVQMVVLSVKSMNHSRSSNAMRKDNHTDTQEDTSSLSLFSLSLFHNNTNGNANGNSNGNKTSAEDAHISDTTNRSTTSDKQSINTVNGNHHHSKHDHNKHDLDDYDRSNSRANSKSISNIDGDIRMTEIYAPNNSESH